MRSANPLCRQTACSPTANAAAARPLESRRMDLSRRDTAASSKFCSTKPSAYPAPISLRHGWHRWTGSRLRRRPGRAFLAYHSAGCVDSRRALRHAAAHGGQSRHRRSRGIHPDLRRHLRHRMESNRRNYRLLHRHLGEPRRHTWRDWVFLLLLAALWQWSLPSLWCLWSGCSSWLCTDSSHRGSIGTSKRAIQSKETSGRSAVW